MVSASLVFRQSSPSYVTLIRALSEALSGIPALEAPPQE